MIIVNDVRKSAESVRKLTGKWPHNLLLLMKKLLCGFRPQELFSYAATIFTFSSRIFDVMIYV
ncbi:hypothetical protein AM501_11855 [Aneurinibacillus migulanus]|uniref:Uncharacterized protein n=1 Tax=Aneurinibacillus migulanus TaxID=47500 RepID=A0A0D1UXD9_ANEMI|nr:hypothetical protein TS65_24415 [Aneurinibacillus migulanus]KIV54560.1 hypothetical protein TS64_16195 [Aneurinibacillus migulanus]KON97855.1 hypothetical protein AF333_22895 [Aneurinibacillus migulanus]KPD08043.1 hypothetical protein AM501_11855 [Aneurinibacillus migulanus]